MAAAVICNVASVMDGVLSKQARMSSVVLGEESISDCQP